MRATVRVGVLGTSQRRVREAMPWRMVRAVIVGSGAIVAVQLACGAAGGDPDKLLPKPSSAQVVAAPAAVAARP